MKHHPIPKDHPRRLSLEIRERLLAGFTKGITAPAGLFAHGRGEAFDYILGEKTLAPAFKACETAAALLLMASYPVISVNGNLAALDPKNTVSLAKETGAQLEVNLFYRSLKREAAIARVLKQAGAKEILGVGKEARGHIQGLLSPRAKVSPKGILKADVILLALEDGDRTEKLVRLGKKVIAIDLNPFSRTAQYADITIVDNVVRALPILLSEVKRLRTLANPTVLSKIIKSFDNQKNLGLMIKTIQRSLQQRAKKGIFLEIKS